MTLLATSLDQSVRPAAPFLKWAGGKRQLLPVLSRHAPPAFGTYYEPFLGSAALFFRLAPSRAVLADAVPELIETYITVRDDVEYLIDSLNHHHNTEEYFYLLRAMDPAGLSSIERASRFIYLNHTCYNGLFRVNRAGRFNVPFGFYKSPRICDAEGLRLAAKALQHTSIRCCDFEEAVARAEAGDFVYFDPPYHPLSATARFTSYSKQGFAAQDQWRLAATYRQLHERGCFLMLSNSDTPLIRDLYADFRIFQVQARRSINSKGDRRGAISEVLILNYEPARLPCPVT